MTTLYTSDDASIGFDATAVGATPSGWTAPLASAPVISTTNPTAGHVHTLQTPDLQAALQTGIAAVADMSVYFTASLAGGLNSVLPGPVLRSNAGGTNGYTITINAPNGSNQYLVAIYKLNGGSYSQIGSTYQSGPAFSTANTMAVRAQIQGSTISVRHWVLGTTEPTSWQLTTTDTSVTAAGYAGVYSSANAAPGGNGFLGEFIVSDFNTTETISVTTPGTVTPGAAMTIAGGYTNGPPTALDYQFDSAGWVAAASPTISGGAFSFSATAPAAGTHTVSVRDHNSTGISGTSGSFTAGTPALVIGTMTATPSAAGITLALSAGLSGGTGAGYSYAIYRGTDPNFAEGAGTLLATVSSMPYTDTTAAAGTTYFYGVHGTDGGGNAVDAGLPGTGATGLSGPLYVAGTPNGPDLAIVFIGDSITYGVGVSNAGSVASPTAPYFCMARLAELSGQRNVYGANTGISGTTTTDWAPGGADYNNAVEAINGGSAASVLHAAHPAAQMVFSIMLGTNDSASSGTNNAPYSGALTAAEYQTKLAAIVTQILTVDWPSAKIVLHAAPWYSPNTHNGASYLQAGLSALFGYRSALAAVVASFAVSHPGQVMLGDTQSFAYFAQNFASELQADGSGTNGVFFLHPAGVAGADGKIGTQSLGEMWATAIGAGLWGGGAGVVTYRGGFERGVLG
jgi:lysophospholipase L1-like esterase